MKGLWSNKYSHRVKTKNKKQKNWWKIKWYKNLEKQLVASIKLNFQKSFGPATSLMVIFSKRKHIIIWSQVDVNIYCGIVCKDKKIWKSNDCLSRRKWWNATLIKGYMSVEMEGVTGVTSWERKSICRIIHKMWYFNLFLFIT